MVKFAQDRGEEQEKYGKQRNHSPYFHYKNWLADGLLSILSQFFIAVYRYIPPSTVDFCNVFGQFQIFPSWDFGRWVRRILIHGLTNAVGFEVRETEMKLYLCYYQVLKYSFGDIVGWRNLPVHGAILNEFIIRDFRLVLDFMSGELIDH